MIAVLKKLYQFAGEEQKNINKSIFWGFFYAIFHMFQIAAIYFVVLALTSGNLTYHAAWTALLLLIASIAGRAVINRFTQLQQTHAGYFMVANKRLVSILSGFINSIVFLLCVFGFDWRIGFLSLAGTALYLLITSAMEKKSARVTPRRQESEAQLVDAILEQIQGMSVIKSFNLTGKGDRRVRGALEYNRKSNLDIERLFTPYMVAQELSLHLFSVLIMGAGIIFCLNRSMTLSDALMTVIISFMVFSQIQSTGSAVSLLRVVGSSIDHADQIDEIPEMDSTGRPVIENNIKFGKPDASHEQVVAAAKKTCCHDFISALPDGYDTVIGEGGATLSGGEKQRISIARAMLKNAPIIIFDEATANVDPENEDKLQKAMEELMRDKTILMIAHRLKTVQKADRILVLDEGRIVQNGTHAELKDTPGIYRDFLGVRKEAAGWKL